MRLVASVPHDAGCERLAGSLGMGSPSPPHRPGLAGGGPPDRLPRRAAPAAADGGGGFPQLATHSRVFVEPTPLEAAIDFLTALRGADGVELVRFGDEWPLLEPLCRQHQLMGHAISDGWIAAAVLAHHDCLVTFDRDFVPLLPPRRLVLLES